MAAVIIEKERRLPYAPADLCKLVGDVRAYPRFIPWLQHIDVLQETPRGEGWEGVAEARVGWKGFSERFATKVVCAPERGELDVTLVRGPFKSLINRWRFAPTPEGGALVRFWIAYEFKNPILQGLAAANRTHAAQRILHAFEREAHRRLGVQHGGGRSPDGA